MENDNVKFKIASALFRNDNKIIILTFLFVILIFTFSTFNFANAATNISATTTEHYAWNDVIGWIDFYQTGNVNATSTQLTGYATSSVGYIALDCATSPNGNICGTSNFKISNDGGGNLTGWAYNDAIGWISFDSGTATSSITYQVTIAGGDFSGWAWNDVIGWISFNCLQPNICGTSDYKVKTSWVSSPLTAELTSSFFDTGVSTGVALNTIMWQGNQPSGASVKFQIASNASSTGGGTGLIDSTYKYAWNDSVGWINFGYSAGNVNVNETQLTGYAYNSNVLEIALDCATTPGAPSDICSTSNFKVSRNSSTGELSGWAWNDNIGWISFSSESNPTPIACDPSDGFGTGEYCVTVNTTTGAFTGWAWNDYIGWISFNCSDPGLCGSYDYRVNTVTTATWNYRGPDGSDTTYYQPTGPGIPAQINLSYHNNHRYFRYKVFLNSDSGRTQSPRVDDVIVNWSP